MTSEIELPDIDEIEAQSRALDDAAHQQLPSAEYETATPTVQSDSASENEDMRRYRGAQRYVQMLVDGWFKTPQRIVVTGCVVAVCLGVITWNLSRLSIFDELIALEATKYELDGQLNDLEIELESLDLQSLTAAIEAESDRIFQGFPQLAAWAEGLAKVAGARGLQFSYKVRESHLSPVPDVLEVPLVLTFKPGDSVTVTFFVECMDLIKGILRDHWHVDVISTHANGDGESLRSLQVQAQVWVRDRYGFIDVADLSGGTDPAPESNF